MKKSLLITLEFPPVQGGISNYYYNLLSNFPPDNIAVLTNNDRKISLGTPYKIYYKKFIYNSQFIWPKWIFLFFIAKKIIKKENIELIHVGHILPIGTVALMIKKYLGIPYLVYTHGMDVIYSQYSKRKKRLVELILKNADYIITNSRFTKEELIKLGASDKKITKVYPCPNLIPKEIDLKEKQAILAKYNLIDKKIILTVSRLVKRKGHDLTIRSLKNVLKVVPNAIYLIIGDGPYRPKLQELTKNLGLQNNVIFLGDKNVYLSQNDEIELQTFYHACHIFIMPAREVKELINNKERREAEGFGMVFLEANLFGKPVIGGRSGGQADAIIDGVTGFLVNPKNEQEIASALIKLLANPDLARRLGEQGRERVLREFQWPRQAQKIVQLLS